MPINWYAPGSTCCPVRKKKADVALVLFHNNATSDIKTQSCAIPNTLVVKRLPKCDPIPLGGFLGPLLANLYCSTSSCSRCVRISKQSQSIYRVDRIVVIKFNLAGVCCHGRKMRETWSYLLVTATPRFWSLQTAMVSVFSPLVQIYLCSA